MRQSRAALAIWQRTRSTIRGSLLPTNVITLLINLHCVNCNNLYYIALQCTVQYLISRRHDWTIGRCLCALAFCSVLQYSQLLFKVVYYSGLDAGCILCSAVQYDDLQCSVIWWTSVQCNSLAEGLEKAVSKSHTDLTFAWIQQIPPYFYLQPRMLY